MKLRIPNINHVSYSGRLTKDPEKRQTKSGQDVVSAILAQNQRYKPRNSEEWKEKASFIPVVFWGALAVRVYDKCKKGTPLHVTGRLDSRTYEIQKENEAPQKRQVTELTALNLQILGFEEDKTDTLSADIPPEDYSPSN